MNIVYMAVRRTLCAVALLRPAVLNACVRVFGRPCITVRCGSRQYMQIRVQLSVQYDVQFGV